MSDPFAPATPQPPPPPAGSPAKKGFPWAIVAIAAAVVVAVIVIVLLITGDDSSSGKIGPKIVTQEELVKEQQAIGHTIYWVGPQPGMQYEYTKTSDGKAYVRYLPQGVQAGDSRPDFLSVGTYQVPDVFSIQRQMARQPGSLSKRVQGGLAVSPANARKSVYVGFPGSNLQAEVYDPSARVSRRLAFGGQVKPVG